MRHSASDLQKTIGYIHQLLMKAASINVGMEFWDQLIDNPRLFKRVYLLMTESVFPIDIEYTTIEGMLIGAGYNKVNSWIIEGKFPVETPEKKKIKNMVIYWFDYNKKGYYLTNIIKSMSDDGFYVANHCHLIAFNKAYPDISKRFEINAPGYCRRLNEMGVNNGYVYSHPSHDGGIDLCVYDIHEEFGNDPRIKGQFGVLGYPKDGWIIRDVL